MGSKASGSALSSRAAAASRSSTTRLKVTAASTTAPSTSLAAVSALLISASGFEATAAATASPPASLTTISALFISTASFETAFLELIVEITLPELLKVPWVDGQSKTRSLHECKLVAGIAYSQSESLAGETAPDESDNSEMLNDHHFGLIEKKSRSNS
ncbi:unnamed protein product [Clonostachys rosea]|uniref:Uncharacterized protein n=1 Tax=Bionectria ochroleuca TaxID=29856 RepID=A0ABY6TR91_BIOOC|nr:unnamed protein product [Clonostachys rosea]